MTRNSKDRSFRKVMPEKITSACNYIVMLRPTDEASPNIKYEASGRTASTRLAACKTVGLKPAPQLVSADPTQSRSFLLDCHRCLAAGSWASRQRSGA